MSASSEGHALPPRARLAVGATRTINGLSRRLGRGGGTVIGGRAGLMIDPTLLARLAAGRTLALVSGTNGKTTTTAMLATALGAGSNATVVTNSSGSNMPAGHLAALSAASGSGPVVLEVDEGYLPGSLELGPSVVLVLNLSRDQLDRTNEVRMLAERWRRALAGTSATVVANADDPLVVFSASEAARVLWVGAGLRWRDDAVGCPKCDGRIEFSADGGWACTCGFARPVLDAWIETGTDAVALVWRDGGRQAVELEIPGEFNRANAAMAVVAASAVGVPRAVGLEAVAGVQAVAGRFSTPVIDGVATRLMLAKNPAGWTELLSLVCPGTAPVVVGINSRVADGRDPSWLWDVDFALLAGRPVIATGERCLDLAVRLRYADVVHRTIRQPEVAIAAAGAERPGKRVEFIGNYTAFYDLVARR